MQDLGHYPMLPLDKLIPLAGNRLDVMSNARCVREFDIESAASR